ncbi:MAG: acetyltransferase [Chloroflexi bacterium]|nr:MAG: acetyltransferase [Chloroflexota bacterium]
MNVERYLERIEYDGARTPNAATLRALHLAQLYHVPFENLDISRARRIVLDYDALYEKIVTRRRGGFCYEVNGLFAWLLTQLGFDVTLLSGSSFRADETFGPEYDHLTLRVLCPADAEPSTPWLADVGFGSSFTEPLRLDRATPQPQGLRAYRIETAEPFRIVWQKSYAGVWKKQFRFSLQPRAFAEFEGMCHYHQTSPQSPFTRKPFITRATPRGRISIEGATLIITTDGARTSIPIRQAEMCAALLRQHFGVDLSHDE